MSAESFIVIYGIKFDVGLAGFAESPEDVELLEGDMHPLVLDAKGKGLDCWYGNFALPNHNAQYSLLVGKILGIFGGEFKKESSIELEEMIIYAKDVKEKLELINITAIPTLLMLWEPDN